MKFNICEFFVGAGGSHLGFMQNGFETLYVNDFDENALKTLVYNNKQHLKNSIIDSTDITKIDPKKLKEQINKDIDVCFGGIVCKGFSLAGEKSPNDERNYFYRFYLNMIKELQPKISIIENVKGMLNAKILSPKTPEKLKKLTDQLWQELANYKGKKANLRKKNALSKEFKEYGLLLRKKKQEILNILKPYMLHVLDDIVQIYESIGYRVDYKILNSAWYGASTKRERLFIVAIRKDIKDNFNFPLPIYSDDSITTKMDFKEINEINFKNPIKLKECLKKIDYSNKNDADNIPMNHNAKTIERFKYIKPNKNIQDSMDELPKDLKISKFYSRGNTMRLCFNELAPTLVPGHSNFPVHPTEHRSITVREAAVISGFPLNYKFFGSHTKRCEQVGNAVPPPLSFAIANETKKFLIKNKERNKSKW